MTTTEAPTTQQVTLNGRPYTYTPGVDPETPHAPTIGELTNSRGQWAGYVAVNIHSRRFVLAGPSALNHLDDDDDRAALMALNAPKPAPCDCPAPGPTCPPR